MTTLFHRIFTDHPSAVGESYVAHMLFAGRFALQLMAAGLAALVHALVPCLFERTASHLIKKMYLATQERG